MFLWSYSFVAKTDASVSPVEALLPVTLKASVLVRREEPPGPQERREI